MWTLLQLMGCNWDIMSAQLPSPWKSFASEKSVTGQLLAQPLLGAAWRSSSVVKPSTLTHNEKGIVVTQQGCDTLL